MRLGLDQIQDFYERCYEPAPDGQKWAGWRELGAVTKAAHIAGLLEEAGITTVQSIAEVGCGDGAVLAALGRRGLGRTRIGWDISSTAVGLAGGRPEVGEARVFDGEHIPAGDRAYDLVIATHVLEHVPSPEPMVSELGRVARQALVIEVPLERNVSARRRAARAASDAAGHLQRFDREQVRRMVAGAGWRVEAELLDPLPLAVHTFAKETVGARARGTAKWVARMALTAVPAVGERMITLHYALLATPR
jgi:SAM-dependent methyltransferase